VNKANISYARNHLSELLARVREGETILIVDRQTPIARLEPAATGPAARGLPGQADLVRRGLVRSARSRLNLKAFRALPRPSSKRTGDVLLALLADREEGR